jgi:hypothetical protein
VTVPRLTPRNRSPRVFLAIAAVFLELSKRNRQALHQMRVPDPVTDRFLENRLLSPRHQTVIVEAMRALHGTPGRAAFIQYAARADSEDAALLFQQMAELLAGYHRSVAPIQRLDIHQNVPVAFTGQGSAAIQKVEVWLTGDASDRAHQGLRQLGITLVEHVGQRLPLLD